VATALELHLCYGILRPCLGELLLLQEAPKAKISPKQGLLFSEAKAEKAHFTLGIEKLLCPSFPSFHR